MRDHSDHPSDLEIASRATPRPIEAIGERLGIPVDALYRHGPHKAKIAAGFLKGLADRPDGRLVLVTAITPTPAGEGKTTTSIGLADALSRLGRRAVVCLREPSLGPCFGVKGGAAGGGWSQVIPMEDINLHFTGDIHAVGTANNLLAAMIDNHVYWGNELRLDPRRIFWRRVVDLNDRALRDIVCSLGGVGNGFPRQDGFDITVASEVMAVFCLADDMADLKRRLGNIIVGQTRERANVTARDLRADGAMAALLKDAIQPNLAQTLEGTPAIIHGGPFANIAHGCNSVIATRAGLKLADYVVTEAGFGADLGAVKFLDIKCRKAGLRPAAAVMVATIRALKMHGGVEKADLGRENVEAVERGFANLARHVENMRTFGLPQVVALNLFETDTRAEIDAVRQRCAEIGVDVVPCGHWRDGGAGALDLARAVTALADGGPAEVRPLYPESMTLWNKVRTIAQTIFGAQGIIADKKIRDRFRELQDQGFGHFPVCIAKTQYSFSTDPNLKGAPANHVVPVREVRLAGGAEFVVVLCGEIMTMPGLPREPAATAITVDDGGRITGLF